MLSAPSRYYVSACTQVLELLFLRFSTCLHKGSGRASLGMVGPYAEYLHGASHSPPSHGNSSGHDSYTNSVATNHFREAHLGPNRHRGGRRADTMLWLPSLGMDNSMPGGSGSGRGSSVGPICPKGSPGSVNLS